MASITLEMITKDLQAALSVNQVRPLSQGGQKYVLTCTLEDVPAVAKVVILPQGGVDFLHVAERAEREVEILATIDSPRVVRVLSEVVELDDGSEPPYAVAWVEERLDGIDLAQEFTSLWPPADVAKLLVQVGEGLAAFHDQDVVHRDLSPGNVRHVSSGDFVLMDPGLARHLAKNALTGLYQPGTPGFRSPEHVPGGDVQPASDIFALGILAFRALVGSLPIDPTGPEDDYFSRLRTYDAPPVESLRPGIPGEIANVVNRCLQRQAARRFLDGQELLEELRKIGGVYASYISSN